MKNPLALAFVAVLGLSVATAGDKTGNNYSNYHSFDKVDSSAPSSDQSSTRVNETVKKDEFMDTASTGQAATERNDGRSYDSSKKTNRAGCRARNSQWLRPQDQGYTECMNMLDTQKK